MAAARTATSKILVFYYAATAVFLLLDYAAGFNVRLAFLDSLPVARAGYYGVCFACLALMVWRPTWTTPISAFESLVTLVALILSVAIRTMVVTDQMIETGAGYLSYEEILNFLIVGGIAYLAWVKGISDLKQETGF